MQCKDIADADVLAAVDTAARLSGFTMATRWDVAAVLAGHPEHVGQPPVDYPTMPDRLLLAKLRKMIRRGVLEGCACGCRGDLSAPASTSVSA